MRNDFSSGNFLFLIKFKFSPSYFTNALAFFIRMESDLAQSTSRINAASNKLLDPNQIPDENSEVLYSIFCTNMYVLYK